MSSTTWLRNLPWLTPPGPKSKPRLPDDEYALLPSSYPPRPLSPTFTNDHEYRFRRRRTCSFRPHTLFSRQRLGLRRLLTLAALAFALVVSAILAQGIPPSFNDVRAYEDRLPQHRLPRHVFPPHAHDHHAHASGGSPGTEGQATRYIRFPGYLWGHGLNNVLQEALVLSHLAHASNLSYVFEDYTWSRSPLPWTLYDFALRPTRIPLNAFIAGPTAGGPLSGDVGDDSERLGAPRAVSARYWEEVCGGGKIRVLTSKGAPSDADGDVLLAWWRDMLSGVQEQCIEVDSSEHDLFDRFLFGGPRFLPILDALLASPILTAFSWSPLVHAALLRNAMLLHPSSPPALSTSIQPHLSSQLSLQIPTPSAPAPPLPFLPGLIAIHLRRGDYTRHCPNLALWGADYMGTNQHPSLPDRFAPPVGPPGLAGALHKDWGSESEKAERRAYYMAHCLPDDSEVVRRLREVRAEYRTGAGAGGRELSRVYVLSNDGAWALEGLRGMLEADGWADVLASRDLVLDAEQRYVDVGVDMAIAERAEVFVGNGFSSLSSNVVMLRMARGMPAESNRFL
ncbi:hypothetical protein CONPUDRAFT_112946 [Coniophora puteana RWD-64-598 SS2]|uniref:Uncharacterized protein n=1 Tax=Coniophora puteana (strain RWD-64-598) TaxID=741705 RepID=A0A5M3M7J7_CONPW|nr:uncharacterized protein CONPUDRAFT_112946 [Coniophora puteana RWD-64-598 SS2]EIW75013.1 hypothetical protein CONPUDRAFT_112946 [Coniophora puteana RWD-64-598 SS2]